MFLLFYRVEGWVKTSTHTSPLFFFLSRSQEAGGFLLPPPSKTKLNSSQAIPHHPNAPPRAACRRTSACRGAHAACPHRLR